MSRCDCPPDDCAARVRRFLAGDRRAGDDLARKFTPLVRAIVRRVLGSQQSGEWDDACQTVFLRVFDRLGRWEARCPFCKWLAVVATNRAIDVAHDARPILPLPPVEIADKRPPPLSPETIACLERVLADLPPEWRRAYEQAIQGKTREEIARAEGKSVRTIQYWLASVRDRLLSCLSS
jgi:RNA polymerase sigma-70 factor (ECF subfamily)